MLIKELVIGSTLESQLYVLLTPGAKLVFQEHQKYYDFERLAFRVLNTDLKKDLFKLLNFMNSMLGHQLFASGPKNKD